MKDALYYLQGPLPETPEPKQRQDPWTDTRVVGKPLPRVDAYERVSGSAVYPSDVTFQDMLYGAILRCPHAHARVISVDTSAAEKMPGVRAVITGRTPEADIPWYWNAAGQVIGKLFASHCRYEGEAVAAVAAETPYQARDAARSIVVEYEELPFVTDYERAAEPDAPAAREEGNITGDPYVYSRGSIDEGFAQADVVVEETYRTACELHTPLEPHGCVAKWDGGRLTVWESTQGVYPVQRMLSDRLGLPLSNVRVVCPYVGGGFGSKLQAGRYTVIAALMARMTGSPVKLFLSREETMLVVGNRPANRMRMKAGATQDGTLTAIEFDGFGSGGAYSGSGTGALDWQIRDLYRCNNVRAVTQSVFINAGEQRPMRAPGHPQCSWALEQMMDQLAEKIGMDPVEFRLRNLPDVSQGRNNIPYTSTGLAECLTEGARVFGWEDNRDPKEDGDVVRGVGVASCLWIAGGGGPPSTAIVKYFADGSVNLNMGASDIGTGTKTVMAMVVAEELGVPLDHVQIEHADTATTQFATASGGSKTVPTESPAVRAAAIDCKNQIVAMAAEELGVGVDELSIDGTDIVRPSNEYRKPIAELRSLRRQQVVVGVGYRGPNPSGKAVCPFAAQFCEVEVNKKTGEVRVLRFLGAHDSGRVMSRLSYDNQVYGGIVMGIGFGMTERRVLDSGQTGKMCNLSWHDYKIPTALDVPADMVSVPIETEDTECNTTGSKGLGEPVTIPTAAAIANAVYHATGVRMTDTPINPTTLVELL
ncbi:MAG: xanthine dehydrogenase family protein molybdopterin-binding subunit, partial [Rhodothermales bacterium]|nr:xanthine dehydrogenase family protein molybdopterin-binding subunit [Rhodothermales bacterium]